MRPVGLYIEHLQPTYRNCRASMPVFATDVEHVGAKDLFAQKTNLVSLLFTWLNCGSRPREHGFRLVRAGRLESRIS